MFLQNKDFSVFNFGLILYLTLPYPGTKKIQKGFRKVGRFSVGNIQMLLSDLKYWLKLILDSHSKLVVCRAGKHGSTTIANIFNKIYESNEEILKKKRTYKVYLWKKWKNNLNQNQNQLKLKEYESFYLNEKSKRDIIVDSLYGENSENYFSFVVCRNPIERLSSVYRYLTDLFGSSWRKLAKSKEIFQILYRTFETFLTQFFFHILISRFWNNF